MSISNGAVIGASVIEHSINMWGDELITIQTKAPKYLDAEIEKHRMISSNSSSDRAIPFRKMVNNPKFLPEDVRLDERGMQGYESVQPEMLRGFHQTLSGIYEYITTELSRFDIIHKQHLNRYLLGFTMQNKVMTANKDQWEYFLNLRLGTDADPAIQYLSSEIETAINMSEAIHPEDSDIHPDIPIHLPYITVDDVIKYHDGYINIQELVMVSVARCARVSYLSHDLKKTNLQDDIKLYKFLLKSKHLTPFEHVAITYTQHQYDVRRDAYAVLEAGGFEPDISNQVLYNGNFKGWTQHRKDVNFDLTQLDHIMSRGI